LLAELTERAGLLDRKERAELARLLIESLDKTEEGDWDAAWLRECEHRLADYDSGRDRGRSLESVLKEFRSRAR
jgi:putative addiction module component (TIGR02574 family)